MDRAVAAEVEAAELRRTVDATSSVLCKSDGTARMLPRLGRSIRRPDGVVHSSASYGASSSDTSSTMSAALVITSSGASAARVWSCRVRTASMNRP